MDDNRKAVEPKDATNCIIKVFKNGKCVRRVYGKCGLEDDDGTRVDDRRNSAPCQTYVLMIKSLEIV